MNKPNFRVLTACITLGVTGIIYTIFEMNTVLAGSILLICFFLFLYEIFLAKAPEEKDSED